MLALGVAGPAARAQACGVPVSIPIANSGFEEPPVEPFTGVNVTTLPGWEVSGFVLLWGPNLTFASGSQHPALGDADSGQSGSVSQTLDGTVLAGSTVTFEIISLRSGEITLGDETQTIIGTGFETTTHTVTFDVPADAPASLPLTLSGSDHWSIDQIRGSYVVPCSGPVIPPGCADAVAGIGPFAGAEIVFLSEGGNGGAGSQVLIGTENPDQINGASGNDLICGGGGNDTIAGGSGNDVLYGDDGNDDISGASGNDALNGGPGSDACQGGSGTNQLRNCER